MGEVPPSLPSPTGVLALSQSHSGCLSHAQTPCRPRGLAVNTVPAWSGTPVRSACDPAQSKACIPAVWPVSQLGSWSSPPERPVHAFQPAAVSTIEVQRWKGLSPSAWCKHAECACVRACQRVGGGTAAPSLQEGQPSQDSPCCRPHGVLQSGPALTQHVSSQILLILPY